MTREQQIVKLVDDYKASDPVANQLLNRNAAFGLVRHVLEWADSHPAWVSVEEELPKENGKTQQSISVWATDGLTSGEFRYNFDTKTWTNMWGDPFDVTHWMSLPTLPVKKGGEDGRD